MCVIHDFLSIVEPKSAMEEENHVISVMNHLLNAAGPDTDPAGSAHKARALFQWGGSAFAIFLLILNRVRRKSRSQTTLLVAYLLSSLPTVLLNIFRGEIGKWIAIFAVAAHLFFPLDFSVSRFLLFVISPSWVIHMLHDSAASGILCLVIGVLLLIDEIRGNGGFGNCSSSLCCLFYCLVVSSMFYCSIVYLCNERTKEREMRMINFL